MTFCGCRRNCDRKYDPDTFFETHPQTWNKIKDLAYVHYGRKKMNRTVGEIRALNQEDGH